MTHRFRITAPFGSLIAAMILTAGIAMHAIPAAAQETGGSIRGTITDAQSAVLPGVTVTLRNDDTNAQQTTVSNEQGAYVLPFVPIGHYTLTAALDGFTTAKQTQIEVRVGDRLRIDLGLKIGGLTEEVTVSASALLLETSSASRGQLISRDLVEDLPLLGRNPFALTQLSPGVQYTPALASRSNRPFDNGGMDNLRISGGRPFTNELLLDGVPNTGTETNSPNNLSFVPSPDATAEFKVQTNLYDAQYGRSGGGVVNVLLKSGSNRFHGAFYEYYRDEKLNANTFDANRGGQEKAGLYWNQPGATVDGPVKIPGLYDGTDKTFFMYSWEQIRSEVPFPQVYTVPTAAQRAGDFSQTTTADGRPVTIYDPKTTTLVGGRYIREPFAANVIPRNRIDPIALALLEHVPLPNAPGQVNNLLVPENARADKYDQHVVKVDQVLNTQHRFFVRLVRNKRSEINDFAGFPQETSPWYWHGRMNVGISGEATSVLGKALVLSSRAGFIRHDFYIQSHADGFDATSLGFPSSLVSQVARKTFPAISMSGYTTFGYGRSNQFTTSDTYSWSEIFSKTAGNHSIHFGGEYRALVNDQQNPTSSFGSYSFTAAFTQRDAQRTDAAAGNAIASMLLGYPASGSVPTNPEFKFRNNYTGVFLQDDWRLTPKLTLNAGVRWDYESPITEAGRQQNRGFDPNAANPFPVPGMTLKGGLLFVDDSNPLPYKRDLNNLQPRVGAAFQVNDKTVIRGGYGLSYLPTFDNGTANGFSVSTPLVASVDGGLTPSASLSNPYPSGLDKPVGSSQGLATLVGRGFTYHNPGRTIPYVHQFSIGAQRELPGRMVVDVSYVGSRTRELPVSKSINETSVDQWLQGNANLVQVPNPFQGLLPGTAFNGATVTREQLLRPFPQFAGITEDRRPIGTTDYDSLQASVNKRLSRGLQFLVSYTYSRRYEEVGYLNSRDDWGQLNRVITDDDAPHRLFVSGTYQIPAINHGRGLAGKVLGGWQMNGIVVFQTGLPVGVSGNSVLVGNPKVDNPRFERWFNTCTETLAGARQNCSSTDEAVVWKVLPPYTLRTTTTRLDNVRTKRPGLLDFSLFKTFNLPSRFQIQARMEAFNLFNTPWFGGPNTDVNSNSFGTVTPNQQNDPRNIQLGIRLKF